MSTSVSDMAFIEGHSSVLPILFDRPTGLPYSSQHHSGFIQKLNNFSGGSTMKCKSLGLAVLFVAFASAALAQTQISGTGKCSKPDSSQSIEVGDKAGHLLVIEKRSCNWTVPIEMAGLKSTTYTSASAIEVNGAKFQVRGYVVLTMDNGDKAYVRIQGGGAATEQASTNQGTWFYMGGTGKLKGLKGKGTYTTAESNGEGEDKVEGTYSLPDPAPPAKK
jgi:hypothetical protein